MSRRKEIIITHSYLLKREEQPYCIGCDTPFTFRHFLIDCADFDIERRSLFQVNNLKDLFKDIYVENISSFLKHVNLVNKNKLYLHIHLNHFYLFNIFLFS